MDTDIETELSKVFGILSQVSDTGQFDKKSFPEVVFRTKENPNMKLFIEDVDPFLVNPDFSEVILGSFDVLKFLEVYKMMEEAEKVTVLRAVSQKLRAAVGERFAARKCQLAFAIEMFDSALDFAIKGTLKWMGSEDALNLIWESVEVFFGDEPMRDCDFVCLLMIQSCLFRVVMSFPSLLPLLMRRVMDYLCARGKASVHNFFGLILKLVISPCCDLLPVMNDIRLLPKIAKIAVTDEMPFQMIVHLICFNVHGALGDARTCKLFCNLVIQSFFVEERSRLSSACIRFIYDHRIKNDMAYDALCTQLVPIIAVLLRKSLTEKNNHDMQMYVEFFASLLVATVPRLDDEYLRMFVVENKAFSLTGALACEVPDMFYFALKMFSISFATNKMVLDLVNSSDPEFFAVLEKFKTQNVALNFGVLKEFVCCDTANYQEGCAIIANGRGLGVVMSLCQATPEAEEMNLTWLIELTDISSNIYEMYRAKVPFRILKRLSEIQGNEVLRCLYLKLYESICSEMFSNSVFDRTIATIKERTYDYPAEVINVFNRFLTRRTTKKHPTSFFRLDLLTGCGIHTPELAFPHDFSVAFSFRVFRHSGGERDTCSRTVVYLVYEAEGKHMSYHIGYQDKSLVLTITKNQNHVSTLVIENANADDGHWHDLVFIVRNSMLLRGVTLLYDGIMKETKEFPHAKSKISMSIHVGAMKAGAKIRGNISQADISAFYCLSTTVLSDITPIFGEGDRRLPNTLRNSVICEMNPIHVKGNKICEFSNQCPSASISFVGAPVPYMKSGRELICTLRSMKNLFPMFTLLKRSCCNCSGRKEHCTHCGALSDKSGSALIEAMMVLLRTFMVYDEDLFTSYHFFSLLAEMFIDINEKYVQRLVPLSTISDFFVKIKNNDLRKDFVENFFFNFRILGGWDYKIVMFYVSSVLKLCFQDYPDDFSFPISALLPWALEKIKHCDAIQILDDYLLKLLESHQYHEDLDCLLLYAVSAPNDSYLKRCLTFITQLIQGNPSLMEEYQYVEPFLLFLGGPCQIEALYCMKYVIEKLNPAIDYQSFCYRVAGLLRMDLLSAAEREQLVRMVSELCVKQQPKRHPCLLYNGACLPLLARIYFNDDTLGVQKFISMVLTPCLTVEPKEALGLFEIPCWMHWLLMLAEPAYHETSIRCISGFVVPVLHFLAEDARVAAIRHMFEYLILYEGQTGFSDTEIITNIMLIAMTGNTRDEKVLEFVLQHLFLTVSYEKTNEQGNIPESLKRFASPLRIFDTRVKVRAKWQFNVKLCELLAKWLIGTLSLYTTVEIGGVRESTPVISAYIIAHGLSNHVHDFDVAVMALLAGMEDRDVEMRARVAKILSDAIKEKQFDTQVMQRITALMPESDAGVVPFPLPAALETTEAIDRFQQAYDSISDAFCNHFADIMKLSEIDERTYIATGPAKALIQNHDARLMQHKDAIEIKELPRVKALEVFLQELQDGSGPWSQMIDTEGKRFKACNRISRRGRRVLMMMNHRFVMHEDAVFKREHGRTSEVALEVVLKYNPAKKQNTGMNISGRFTTEAQRISLTENYTGLLRVGNAQLVFSCKEKVIWMRFADISFIMNRRLLNREVGIEVFLKNGMSYMFALDEVSRASFYASLAKLKVPKTERTLPGKFNFFAKLQDACGGIYQNHPSDKLVEMTGITTQWRQWNITTYEYLYYLNILGGRSFCDTSQYPIYPWVIMDVSSHSLNLEDDSIYRDLSKSMLGLSESKLETEISKWNDMADDPDRCLSREMLSSSAGVVNEMIRVEPFTTEHITLQSGAFDNSDRLFDDVKEVNDRLNDQGYPRESIPEFYTFPYMFVNENRFNFGIKANHKEVDDVHLPPWSSSNYHFVSVERQALESRIVSNTISNWIDLVFGVHRMSFEHANVFPPWAYPEFHIYDDQQTELFGCMPQCLFSSEHPKRNPYDFAKYVWEASHSEQCISALKTCSVPILAVQKGFVFSDNRVFNTDTCKWNECSITEYGNVWCMSRCLRLAVLGFEKNTVLSILNIDTGKVKQLELPNSITTCACICGGEFLVTGSDDSSIHVYRLPELDTISVSAHQSSAIITVAGNADAGMVVSINDKYMMVIETLYDGRFINAVKIAKEPGVIRLVVFKSGTIAFATPQIIIFFDSRGVVMNRITVHNAKFDATDSVSMAPYYDYDQRELLLLTLGSHRVTVIDVATQITLTTYNANIIHPIIYPIKRTRSCLVCGRDTEAIEWFSFHDSISPIEKNKKAARRELIASCTSLP